MKKYILCLCAFVLIAVTNSSIAKSEITEKFSQILVANIDKSTYKKLIIGKWHFFGSVENGPEKGDGFEIEFFEDNTYLSKPLTEEAYKHTTYGEYIVLSDGRLKRTFEYCKKLPCEKIINLHGISFPDRNTLHIKIEGKKIIYKRVK